MKKVKRCLDLLQNHSLSIFSFIILRLKSLLIFLQVVSPRKIKPRTKLKPFSHIPGRMSLPIIGTILDFNSKFGPRYVHELSVERHNEYGDIFRERFFQQELIFVRSTELLKEWMAQEGTLPVSLKQVPSKIFAEENPELKRGLFFRNGEEWSKLRKLGHTLLIKNASYFDAGGLYENCEVFLEEFILEIKNKVSDEGEFGLKMTNLEEKAYEVVVGCNIRLVYGTFSPKDFQECTGTDLRTLSKYSKDINVLNQSLLEFLDVRLAKWFGSDTWTEYSTKLHHNLSTCLLYGREKRKEILANITTKEAPSSPSMRTHGLLYKSVKINQQLNNNFSSTEDFDDLLCDFAIDSKDPVATTLIFLTQVLAACPDIQKRIFEEVSQIYESNERISFGKIKDLKYSKAFVKEIMRLYPAAPFSTRIVSDDDEEGTVVALGPYVVPPGTMILYSTYAAHRDPRYFPEPLKVIPERWLEKNRDEGEKKWPTCNTAALATFGLNQRLCLGQNIATSVCLLYLANLVRTFKLDSSHGMPESVMRTVLYPAAPELPIHFMAR